MTQTVAEGQGSGVRRKGTFASLRNRDFLLYWLGNLAAFMGMQMQMVAQGWLVLDLTNSPFYLGLVGAVSSLPFLFLSLFGGVTADRMDRRNLLAVTQSLMVFPALAIGFLTAIEAINIWHLIGISLLFGAFASFNMPARQAYVAELVRRDELMNAIALSTMSMNITRVVGPSIGGLLIAGVGVAGAFYLNGAFGVLVVLTLLLIPARGAANQPDGQNMWQNIMEGLRYVRRSQMILTILLFGLLAGIFGMSYQMILPVFARDVYGVGAEGLGFLMGASGVGALAGSLTIAALGNIRRKGWVMIASGFGFGISLILFAISPTYPVALAMQFLVGAVSTAAMAVNNTILQTVVPNELRGRVMSIMMATFGLMPMGSLLTGGIASVAGAPLAVAFCGGMVVLAALVMGALSPAVRRLD